MMLCVRTIPILAFALLCAATQSRAGETLHVLLQGSSSAAMATLVNNAGGTVTHDLHIINAVGATLSQNQLDEVLNSRLVTRHIDDLADTKRPDVAPEAEEDCKVRGHIELDFTPHGIRWPLYNKRPVPAHMETLKLTWPPALGAVTKIALGETTIDPALYSKSPAGSLKIKLPASGRPVIKDRADLNISFSTPASNDAALLRQSDFKLEIAFVGGCSTDLVPGYVNNHEDFYYNSVAGVDALHRQGVTGKGVTVAVIDSGLWEHAALVKDTAGRTRLLAR